MQDLTHDQAIDALRNLPEDKQRQVLGQLTPEQRQGILTKLQAGGAAAPPPAATTPATLRQKALGIVDKAQTNLQTNTKDAPDTGGFLHDNVVAPVVHVANRIASNVVGAGLGFAHEVLAPPPSFQEQLNQGEQEFKNTSPAAMVANNIPLLPGVGSQVQQDVTSGHPVGDVLADVATGALAHGVSTTLPGRGFEAARTPGEFKENVRNYARNQLGVDEGFSKNIAEKYSKEQQGVEAANQKATEDTLRERGVVDEKNAAKLKAHAEKTRQRIEANTQALKDAAEKRARALSENTRAAQSHEEAVTRAMQERAAAEHTDTLRTEAEKNYDKATQDYFDSERKIKGQAKAANDTQWDALRKVVGDVPIDPSGITNVVEQQRSAISTPEEAKLFDDQLRSKMSPEEVAEDMGLAEEYDKLSPEMKANVDKMTSSLDNIGGIAKDGSEPLTFNKLHGIYTELGMKLSRGNLPGQVWQGLKTLRESIGGMMQTVADQAGVGEDLKAARQSNREYQEAFGRKPVDRMTLMDQRMQETNPEAFKAQREQTRLAALAKISPELVDQHKNVQAARETARSFPSQESLRKGLPEPPDRPSEKPLPGPVKTKPLPKAPELDQYGQPKPVTPEAEVPDISEAERAKIKESLKKYGRAGAWVFRLGIGTALGSSLLEGHHMQGFGSQYVLGEVGLQALTRILQRDSVMDWMTRPSAETLRAIDSVRPEDAARLRAGLTQMALKDIEDKHALSGKIDPRTAKFLGPENMALITAAVTSQKPKNADEAKKMAKSVQSR
jgi:hypothetical protein